MIRKIIFIDESGQREYGEHTDPYFVNCGVIVDKNDIAKYETELRGLKRAFFSDPNVEIKSHWLRRPEKAAERYLKKNKIELNRLKEFVEAMYRWIENAEITFIASVIDKPALLEKYKHPWHSSTVAYRILIQRYHKYLEENQVEGETIFDDISGKTKAGNEWKKLLYNQHKALQEKGCKLTGMKFPLLKGELEFKDSAEYTLLQLADLAAYNVFRQMREHGGEWTDKGTKSVELYDWLNKMVSKFRLSEGNIISGRGIVVYPDENRKKWKIKVNKME